MIPILFSKNTSNFNTNGIGRLSDVHSCTIEETLNGIYELELKIGIGSTHYEDIEVLSVIQAFNGTSLQAFDVYKISRPIGGIVTVNARHVRYRLNKCVCMPFSVASSASACSDTLAGLVSNSVEPCGFTFTTDVTTAGSYSQLIPATIGERLAGVEGSVLDQFGGQYEFDNFNVILHNHRGDLYTGVTIKYGKNLTDLKQETNIANTLVGIVPYWSDINGETVVTLSEKVIYSSRASSYPRKLIAAHDFSQLWEEAPTEAQLRSAAQAYVGQSGFGVPVVSVSLSFVPLWETEEYKDIAPVEELELGDTVTVLFEELGVSNEAQIVGYKYDVIREKYISMEVGNLKSNLETTLSDAVAETVQSIDFASAKVLRQANSTASEAINNATAWLTNSNGYVVAVKDTDGSWKELLFMNTNDTSTATYVLRINTNGIGFSTTGINGPYTNAWTIDGNLLASYIKTGILSDLEGKFSLNMETGALSMADGTFSGTINSSVINGGTINVGTYNNVDGVLNIYDSSGSLVGVWDKTGLNINDNFEVDPDGHMTATGATIGGSIEASDTDGWIRLSDSYISGGKGSPGYNTTWINFANIINSTQRVIELKGRAVSLSVSDLFITTSEGDTTVAVGQSGTFGNLGFKHGLCTSLTETTGDNCTIKYIGEDGSTVYSLTFKGGLLTSHST